MLTGLISSRSCIQKMVQQVQENVPLEDPFDGNMFAHEDAAQQGEAYLRAYGVAQNDLPSWHEDIRIKRVHWPSKRPSPPPVVSASNSIASIASNSVHAPSWSSASPSPPPGYIDNLLSIKTVLALVSVLVILISIRSTESAILHQSLRLPLRPLLGVFDYTPRADQPISPPMTQHIRDIVRDVAGNQWSPRDFALAVDGATIVASLTTGGPPRSAKNLGPHPAETILRDNSIGGRCWSMQGSRGQVGIMVPHFIHPSSITVDHAPAHIAVDISQAPRRITVWGLLDEDSDAYLAHRLQPNVSEAPLIADAYVFMRLADIEYNIHASQPSQTFEIDPEKRDAKLEFGVYVIEVMENWGGLSTCMYRIRIHGDVSE